MVKPGGTGTPIRFISARFAPLPPSTSRIWALPSFFFRFRMYKLFFVHNCYRYNILFRLTLLIINCNAKIRFYLILPNFYTLFCYPEITFYTVDAHTGRKLTIPYTIERYLTNLKVRLSGLQPAF